MDTGAWWATVHGVTKTKGTCGWNLVIEWNGMKLESPAERIAQGFLVYSRMSLSFLGWMSLESSNKRVM